MRKPTIEDVLVGVLYKSKTDNAYTNINIYVYIHLLAYRVWAG